MLVVHQLHKVVFLHFSSYPLVTMQKCDKITATMTQNTDLLISILTKMHYKN